MTGPRPPPAGRTRTAATDPRTVQSIGDAQNPIRLGHRRYSCVTGQPRIGRRDPDPTEPAAAERTPR